jgi:hypothetical protein
MRGRRSRRSLVFWAGVALAVIAAMAVVPVVPIAGTAIPPAAASTTSSCPNGLSACVTQTIPPGCTPGTSGCATVTVGPTTGLGNGQYVFVQINNLKITDQALCAGLNPCLDQATLAFCPLPLAASTQDYAKCADGQPKGSIYSDLTPASVPADASGSLNTSEPTAFDPSGPGATPIDWNYLNATGALPLPGGFFCDATHPCGLVVIDSQNPVPTDGVLSLAGPLTASNHTVFPLTFANLTSGCPASNAEIIAYSSYSVQQFVPAAVESTCNGPSGVTALNNPLDTQSAVGQFGSGQTPVAFTDEPDAGFASSALTGKSYEYVPVAVSSTVVAFQAFDGSGANSVPRASYDLTPNMVAGLITNAYTAAYQNDTLGNLLNYECPGTSKTQAYYIVECTQGPGSLNSFQLLNPAAAYQSPFYFQMYPSSVVTGSSEQIAQWICTQGNVPFKVNYEIEPTPPKKLKKYKPPPPTPESQTVTDPRSAAGTLTTPFSGWPEGVPWPMPNCQDYPGLPIISSNAAVYPSGQSFSLHKGSPLGPNGYGQPSAYFATMDASEAAFYGLNDASLLNAAGAFVPPSQTSIDAALDDGTVQPNGVVSLNLNDTADAAAYVLPTVTYALVSTAPQPQAQADAVSHLLTALVTYSHSGGSVPLPAGYVPLPDNLYHDAIADIAKIKGNGVTGSTGHSPGFIPGSGEGGAGGANATAANGTAGLNGAGANGTDGGNGTGPNGRGGRGRNSRPLTYGPRFEPVLVALITGTERWLLPILVALAAAGILLGPVLIAGVRLRRARVSKRAP